MNRVVKILIERDGMRRSEAIELVQDVKRRIEEATADGDYEEAEMILESELNLELDYMFDILES